MYESLINDKKAQAQEALTAWKSVIQETFDANGKHGLDEKTWTGQQREKQEKAKADFARLNNEVIELQKKQDEAKEIEQFESFYTKPATRLPKGNGADAYVGPSNEQKTGPAEMHYAIEARKANGDTNADKAMFSPTLKRFMNPVERQAHREAFALYVKHGEEARGAAAERLKLAGIGPQEIQLLSGVSGSLGGYAVPEDFRAEVVRPRPGFAVVRAAGARTMPTSGDTLVMPRVTSGADPYSSGVSGAWRSAGYVSGGTAPSTQNQPTLRQERVQVFWWQPDVIELDPSLIMDNAINLEQVIGEELGRTRGLDEDSAFINGSGVGQPQGLLNSGATAVNLANDAVSYDTLIDLVFAVPAQYRAAATHLMASATFAEYMKLETSSGVTLIFPGFARSALNNATPGVANLLGYPVMFSEFMPALGNVTKSHLFGDFFYYVIAQREELRVQRLVERYAPNVGILASARVGGQVVLPDAFRIGTTT